MYVQFTPTILFKCCVRAVLLIDKDTCVIILITKPFRIDAVGNHWLSFVENVRLSLKVMSFDDE